MKYLLFALSLVFALTACNVEDSVPEKSEPEETTKFEIPKVLHNLEYDETGRLYAQIGDNKAYLMESNPTLTSESFGSCFSTGDKGLLLDLNNSEFNGTLFYGFIPDAERYSYTIYYKKSKEIIAGKSKIDIADLTGKYDMVNWQETGRGLMGYRILDETGFIWHEGRIRFEGKGPFVPAPTIIEGPFLSQQTHNSIVVSFKTNLKTKVKLTTGNSDLYSSEGTDHEIKIIDLEPQTEYDYTISYGDYEFSSSFSTAPIKGSRNKFTFGFTSDSRGGPGGGERDIFGANNLVMQRMVNLAKKEGAVFFQFTGDLIDGYLSNEYEQQLQYSNWKHSIEPAAHTIPFNIGMGNHESLNWSFSDGSKYGISVDRFPYETHSGEVLFGKNFSNPISELKSEDGNEYDPDQNTIDFPSYEENVYDYVYGNVAVIVMNSNYWYSPSRRDLDKVGGNLHGYIMDNQLEWYFNKIDQYTNDPDIDHIFATMHTPLFPNGGHMKDDMWYNGDNTFRPYIAGKPVKEGIIERRDALLNKVKDNDKFVAFLAGDEHNYSRTKINYETDIYPENWDKDKIPFSTTIWQITNGSAGAPYYAQEQAPWTPKVETFSSKYALCLFHVEGKEITLEVLDPMTMDLIEEVKLK